MELISVIVPIYKVEPYLNRCVESILNQTYTNLEIILVDDGSPDNCPQMCDAWAEKDSRIKVIHKENGGLSDARNAGMAVMTGEYVSFVDSDDYLDETFIASLYNALDASGADVAECGVTYVNEYGKQLRDRSTAMLTEADRTEALRRLILEDGIYQTVWNKLYKRDVISGIDFPKGKHHEDDFWTWKVFNRINKLVTVQKQLYFYLQRADSIIGAGYTIKRLDGLEARYERMLGLQQYDHLRELTRQQLAFDCMWHLQSVKNYLHGNEQKETQAYIMTILKKTPRVPLKKLTANAKYKVWYLLFCSMPMLTVKVRNLMKIGI